MVGSELANCVEVPVDFDRGLLEFVELGGAYGSPDRIEIEFPPQHNTRRQRHFGVINALRGKIPHHPAGDKRVVFGGLQTSGNKLKTGDKPLKICVLPGGVDLLRRDCGIEQAGGSGIDGAFKVEMQFRIGHIIEVLMTAAEMEAIVNGTHGDAFAVLGPHIVDVVQETETKASPDKSTTAKSRKLGTGWEIRAFLPHAKTAWLLLDGRKLPMPKVHKDGLYIVAPAKEPGRYQFELELWDGSAAVVDDAYRFGTVITDFDLHLHAEGTLFEVWKSLGAHRATLDSVAGVRFAVWAPNAGYVSVVGDFNEWDTRRNPMRRRNSGVWEIFLPGAKAGDAYKYLVRSNVHGQQQLKADPYGFASEVPPRSASIVADLDGYEWKDAGWVEARGEKQWLNEPFSIYEVHLESWMRGPTGEPLTYRQMAVKLVDYVKRLGYTHVELLPITEYPYSGSWGYQVVGYFAPTSRFGTPADFKYFIDACHGAGIGVIVDWVPAHFPKDAHGLASFDGTKLYEHADSRMGEHLEWGTLIFNFGRNEVKQFLIASAMFWLKEYHIDGLRVDAVASMLYLDYERKPGEWLPNKFGGRENLEAIDFLRRFNELAHEIPGVVTIAEESTSFPGVSRPVYAGGLGFTMKWNMGWMHDMLDYFAVDPLYRKFHHNKITFSIMYAFSENFVLPISHDEVVYGKRSLLRKMPGDEWQRFANVRAFLAYMYTHPGKKLLFMGSEIGDYNEWNAAGGVPWQLLQFPLHAGLQRFVRELNEVYRDQPALYQVDFKNTGFEWIDFTDIQKSIIAFTRRAQDLEDEVVVICNFTPEPRFGYEVGVPKYGYYKEILNSDGARFGGGNLGNGGGVMSVAAPKHGRPALVRVTLPPLAVLVLKRVR